MNKVDDPNAPKNQEIVDAPHGGRDTRGNIVVDSTESTGQQTEWESTSDLDAADAHKPDIANEEGYSSGPDTFVAHGPT